MSDYISREWLSNAIHNFFNGLNHNVTEEDIQAYINATPSADVRENIYGEWIYYNEEFYQQGRFANVTHRIRECSICHHQIADFVGNMNFCPNCGADMRGK